MNATKVRRIIGVVILLVSLALLVWGLWPYADGVRLVPITPEDMQLPTSESFIWWFDRVV